MKTDICWRLCESILPHDVSLRTTLEIRQVLEHPLSKKNAFELGLGDMAQKIITKIIFTSVDIDNYHDKCEIFISFKFKARFLLQSESFRNQTINFP